MTNANANAEPISRRRAWLSFFAWRITAIALAVLTSTAVAWALYARAMRLPPPTTAPATVVSGRYGQVDFGGNWGVTVPALGVRRLYVDHSFEPGHSFRFPAAAADEPRSFGPRDWRRRHRAHAVVHAVGVPMPMYRHWYEKPRGYVTLPMQIEMHGALGGRRWSSPDAAERATLPIQPIWMNWLINVACYTVAFELLFLIFGGYQTQRGLFRRARRRCPRCAYDLSHTPAGAVCSECAWPPAKPYHPFRVARAAAVVVLLVASCGVIVHALGQVGRGPAQRMLRNEGPSHRTRWAVNVLERTDEHRAERDLFAAIHDHDVRAARRALRAGADPNFPYISDSSPLVRVAGATFAPPECEGVTPLGIASLYGDPDIVKLLLDAGASPHEGLFQIDEWIPPLALACHTSDLLVPGQRPPTADRLDTVDLLLAAGSSPAPQFSISRHSFAQRGEDWGSAGGSKITAVMLCPDPLAALGILERLGVDASDSQLTGLALSMGQSAILERYADRSLTDGDSNQSRLDAFLRTSVRSGVDRLGTMRLLLKRGADPNCDYSMPPAHLYDVPFLQLASAWGYLAEVRLLLEYGADPNRFDPRRGDSPLECAVAEDHREIVALLLEHGADPTNPPDLLESAWSDEVRAMLRRALEQWDEEGPP